MSLINDALKKAQNRHGESAPSVPPSSGPATVPTAPRKGKTPAAKIALTIAGIALLCTLVSVSVTLLVLRKDEPAPVAILPVASNSPATSPILPAQPSAPVAAPAPSAKSAIETPATTPGETTPIASPSPSDSPLSAPPASPITPAAATPPPPVIVAPAIQLGTRIQSFVDRLRVTSIRISDTGNKAILNDRLFRVDDIVEPSLGLRLTDIQPKLLTFTDESGETYLRRF
jgi:hypothetical protein